MSKYMSKIIEGRDIRPENIRIPRALSIYRVAKAHPFVTDVACRITAKGDIVILMTIDSEIPDLTIYDIHEKEPVAIICSKKDDRTPEVYALRKDFPLGLPHSNAVPFDHPVSLCVSDIQFQDYRTNFSAFAFIELIRNWFAKNAIGQLHEKDRPLEVFYNTEEFSYFPIKPDATRFYRIVRYTKLTNVTSLIEEVDRRKEKDSIYSLLLIPVSVNVSGYIRRIPKKLGDLRGLNTFSGDPFIEAVIGYIVKSPYLRQCSDPLMIGLIIPLSREKNKEYEDINLFVLRIDTPVRELVRNTYLQIGKRDSPYLDNLDIKLSFIIDGLTRSKLNACNGLEEPLTEASFLGTGALGSQILDHFARKGQAETIHLIDADMMAPHNICRHTLDVKDVMKYKVGALRQKYQGIDGLKIYSYPEDFLRCKPQTLERVLSTTDLVIDASTSVGVERHLALDLNNFTPRRCTTFLNPKGTDIVLMMEDKDRCHRLDLLEMDYYRNIIILDSLEHHLDLPGTQRTNLFSCRAESVIMDFDNITALSSIVAGQLPKAKHTNDALLAIWQMDSENGNISRLNITTTRWPEYKVGDITIYVCGAVLEEMNSQREDRLQKSQPVETGGTFLGTYDKDRNIIYVVYMIPAPDDSIEAGTSYIRGVKGLYEKVENIKKRTGHQMVYLGEWHSHPKGCSNFPSPTDMKLFTTMSDELLQHDYPFVMGILSDDGLNMKVQM